MRRGSRPYFHLPAYMTMGIVMLAVGCNSSSTQPVHPAPVVPTKSPLPYSAQIRLIESAAYMVEPGATLRPVSNLRNSVTETNAAPILSGQAWNKAILEHVSARQTFRRVVTEGPADVAVRLRLFVFIDPGVESKFRDAYVAEAEAVLQDFHNGSTLATYVGFGKALGSEARDSREDDEGPIDLSVQRALNDLLGKIENDKRTLP